MEKSACAGRRLESVGESRASDRVQDSRLIVFEEISAIANAGWESDSIVRLGWRHNENTMTGRTNMEADV